MAFKPKTGNTNTNTGAGKRDSNMKFPEPKAGNRPARVSLIVDLGLQERKDFEDPTTKELKPQKPADQIAIFLDLTSDVVDYGGTIGMQPYRLMLNKSFAGEVEGINFGIGPVRDPQGTPIQGRPWNYHPMSIITKLAKATKCAPILEGSNLDLEQLLNQPLMAMVEVKKTEDKNGKKDDNGKVITYTNVNFRGVSELPEMPDGSVWPVPECATTPRVISFDNATVEDIKFIRRDILKKIKLALNYEGSQIQKAIQEFESSQPGNYVNNDKPVVNKKADQESAMPTPDYDSYDDSDIPF